MRDEPSTERHSDETGRSIRLPELVAALAPPLIALAGHAVFSSTLYPWTLFVPAVLISGWVGGFRSGIVSGLLSIGLVWWYFIPPHGAQPKGDLKQVVATAVFISVSLVMCLAQRRAQQARRALAASLINTRELNERLERALTEREIFAALVANSSDFIGIASPEGKPTYVNPAGRQMVGLSPDFPIESTRIEDYYPPSERAFASNVILETMRSHGHWEGETRFRNWRTDEAIPVWDTHFIVRSPATQRIIGMATITRDTTTITRARAELETANEHLHHVADDLREAQKIGRIGSWFYNPATGEAVWSDEVFRIFGLPPGSPIPKVLGPQPLMTPEGLEAFEAAAKKLLEDGSPIEMDAELIRADGSTRWATIRGIPARNASGDIIGVTGTTQDITELKDLQRLREEWMSVVAHDLRQPIGVIRMAADLLPDLHEGEISTKEQDVTKRIRTSAIDLSRMVDDLLDVSRIEAHRLTLEPAWIDARALVDETVARLAHVTEGVRVTVAGGHDLPSVFADAGRVGQVLGNLISNALKYGDRTSDIEIELTAGDDMVTIAVTNHGKGIHPAELKRLFQRFARTRDDRQSNVPGLGLGLYIAKGLVDAHGGRLWGKSDPGKTTTFAFTLPTRPIGSLAEAA